MKLTLSLCLLKLLLFVAWLLYRNLFASWRPEFLTVSRDQFNPTKVDRYFWRSALTDLCYYKASFCSLITVTINTQKL